MTHPTVTTATGRGLLGKNWEGDHATTAPPPGLISGYYTVLDDRGRARTYEYLAGRGFYTVYHGRRSRRVARYAPGMQRPGMPPSIPVVYAGLDAEAAHTGPLTSLFDDPAAARVAYALADPTRPRCARCNRPAPNAARQNGLGTDCYELVYGHTV